MLKKAIDLAEQGRLPDVLVRAGMRSIVSQRRQAELRRYRDRNTLPQLLAQMRASPVAINTADANQQHYEVSADFFDLVLGEHKKYSCALFPDDGRCSLSEAEAAMLALTCSRARIADQQHILELGCGWGSLTLWMAEQYPNCKITAVSNSATQKAYIDSAAEKRELLNITVLTCDMNEFDIDQQFDRVVCIEMFEHMRNHALLFERIQGWLAPEGKLFLHSFCHLAFPYFYETESDSDWMATHFFRGGLMPSWDLPLQFQQQLTLEDRWQVNGRHYARTCAAWLANCDRFKAHILEIFAHSPNPAPPIVQFHRWRMFFMACESLFAYHRGNEWFVGHYLFKNN
jgi:cyclopropane-fatty-acyl-phospholipid synthase